MYKRKVILVTDGDIAAKGAVETAASNIGGRCISFSAGNPTILTGYEIVELIKAAKNDPVVVMVDDRGRKGRGAGESAMESILNNENIEVIGVVAVSSDGKDCNGIKLSCSWWTMLMRGEIFLPPQITWQITWCTITSPLHACTWEVAKVNIPTPMKLMLQ